MSTTNDDSIPYLDALWEREDGEWSWAMLAASVVISLVPIWPASVFLVAWPTAVLYLLLVFWTGLADSWRDAIGLGLYVSAVGFALFPLLAAGAAFGASPTAGGAAGATLGATFLLPIFLTLAGVAIGIAYYLRS